MSRVTKIEGWKYIYRHMQVNSYPKIERRVKTNGFKFQRPNKSLARKTSTLHEIDPQNSNLDQKPALRKCDGKGV